MSMRRGLFIFLELRGGAMSRRIAIGFRDRKLSLRDASPEPSENTATK